MYYCTLGQKCCSMATTVPFMFKWRLKQTIYSFGGTVFYAIAKMILEFKTKHHFEFKHFYSSV